MFDLFAGTQVPYWRNSRCLRHSRKVFILYRSLICSRSEPFRPEEQLLSAEGEIFLVTNLVTPQGIDTYISWSDIPQFLNSCSNPGSISNSLQSDLQSDSVNFGLKLLDMFRSEVFQLFMLFFYSQCIRFYLDLIFFWLDLSFSFVFWIYSGNYTCSVGKKRCHHLSQVSHKQCHRLNPVSKKWFCIKITCQ